MTNQYLLDENNQPLFRTDKTMYEYLKKDWWALVLTMKHSAKMQLQSPICVIGVPNNFRLMVADPFESNLIVDVGKAPSKKRQLFLHIQIGLEEQVLWTTTDRTSCAHERQFRELVLFAGVSHLASCEKARSEVHELINKLYGNYCR